MDRSKTAIILGASGLVGSSLLQILLESPVYDRVIAFVRSSLGVSHPKLETHIIDFSKPDTYTHLVKGDEIFCCLGTTIKKAGSKKAFRKVDYKYPVRFAETAKANNVKQYLLVSSIGADSESSVFYLRTKGKCEDAIRRTGIVSVSIFRPASLTGNRKEFRLGEKISLAILKTFSFALAGRFAKYKPIAAHRVAQAMYEAAQNPKAGCTVYESDEIRNGSHSQHEAKN